MPYRTEDLLRFLLESLGYDVEGPARLEGRSGVSHDFALYAKRGEEKGVAIDVEGFGKPSEISVLAVYAKAVDVGLDRSVLVTDAPITDMAGRLAEMYNIRIVHPRTPAGELRRKLEDFLRPDRAPSHRLVS